MSGVPAKMLSLSGLAILAIIVGGCDGAGEEIEVASRPLGGGISGTPAGMTCGTSYLNSFGVGVESESCKGVNTTLNTVGAPNYMKRSVGDRGMPSGKGFFTQSSQGEGAAAAGDPTRLALLPGTVCGFKENCNNSGDKCLGFDPTVSCPPGWTRHASGDQLGPSGCGFFWCSYNDPNGVCCSGGVCDAACINNMPRGTTCGMGDFRYDDGFCKDRFTMSGCPAGFHRSSGNYDYGRPAGNGLYWCTKN